jgi:murein DD-endopeptidase MepM/ murein hydrolase activator NlpD
LLRILAVFRVHNGADVLPRVLDALSGWCDDIYAIDDRSTDNSAEILRQHPSVTNLVRARSDLPRTPWLISEPPGLELLYRMADFCQPDWIMMIDSDQVVEADVGIREVLTSTPDDVAALMCPMIPAWHDPDYPDMIPVMGTAESVRGPFWRWHPGLRAGTRVIHNPHWPANITDHGRIGLVNEIRLHHTGWATLAERIGKVEHYRKIDPDSELNYGVPYDRALLFGYAYEEIDLLKADYERRVRGDFDPAEPGARLPIDRDRLALGSGYGRRAAAFHPGVDFAADPGTPVHAVTSGTVCGVRDLDGRGLRSVTISGADVDTVYVFRPGEQQQIGVDDQVAAGAHIGAIGAQAESPDGFLHFEVRIAGRHTSPVRYLANMGLQPWPPAGRPRPVAGTFPPSSPCTITA